MKKSIMRTIGFAATVALLCVGMGCDGNGKSTEWDGQVDGFLGRVNEGQGTGGGGGTSIRKVTVSSIAPDAEGSGNCVVGQTVRINAGIVPSGRRTFEKWTTASKGVTFADPKKASTSFIMPANDVTVTANFFDSVFTFTDVRDDKVYQATTIGGKTWMAQNLDYSTQSGSWCYNNNSSNCNTYGRMYDWGIAKNACPSGWHLPTKDEWDALVASVGGAGKKLKATSGWSDNGNGTDDYGFSALPGGSCYSGGNFSNVGYNGYWWTATEDIADYAYFRYMYYNYDGVYSLNDNKSYAWSVRCVGD
jgi:uncharacterized protein (TIGR02145 family)